MSLQTFAWDETQRSHYDARTQRTYYRAFTLSETRYVVGDAVYLLPESEGMPLHLGRLQAAYTDASSDATDLHNIVICWYERLANLEAPSSLRDPILDREVVELEDADVNPIGCLAGKAAVFRVHSYDEVDQLLSRHGSQSEWFFCRGVFKQSSGEFVLYDALPAAHAAPYGAVPEDVGDSDEVATARNKELSGKKRQKTQHGAMGEAAGLRNSGEQLPDQPEVPAPKKVFDKGPGKQCVECGATQTPQWREGPAGPKTLCNACGVRYNRLRASKKNGTFPRQSKAKAKNAAAAKESLAAAVAAPSSGQVQPPHAEGGNQLTQAPRQPQRQPQQPRQPPQQQQAQQPQLPAGRPQRQAALVAASRTATFARTGAFPSEDGSGLGAGLGPSGFPGAEDSSLHSSESAEELCLHGARMAAPGMDPSLLGMHGGPDAAGGRKGKSNSKAAAHLPLDMASAGQALPTAPMLTARTFTAAASLVAMAHQPDSVQGQSNGLHVDYGGALEHGGQGQQAAAPCSMPMMIPAAAPMAAPAAPASPSSVLRGVAVRAVSYCPDIADEFGEVVSNMEVLQGGLPDEMLRQLQSVTEQVDAAANEAAAADAALQAVMQVLAARQKAADLAHERAAAAVDKLKACMCDVMQQHNSVLGGGPGCIAGGPSVSQPSAVDPLYGDPQPFVPGEQLQPTSSADGKGLLDSRVSWSQLDQEHVSLLDGNLFGGAADSGAALLNVDCGFGSSLIKVRN